MGLRALVPLLRLGVWWLMSALGRVPANLLPTRSRIGPTFWTCSRPRIWSVSSASPLTRAAVGLVIGGSIGLVLGIAVGLSRLGQALVDSSMQLLGTVPFIALSPLFICGSGSGMSRRKP